MRKLLVLLFPLFLIFACSTSNEEELPQTTQEDLKEAIVGKWDVENSDPDHGAQIKQANSRCRIFTLIFNSDGTFVIDHQDGVTTGEYTVLNNNTISLGNSGSIGNISFVGTTMVFFIELNGVCSMTAQLNRDVQYVAGDCYSFLNCFMGTFWQSTEEESTAFLFFENYRNYFNRWEFFETERCQEIRDNRDATYVLIQNHRNELKFIREQEGSRSIYTYRKGQEGRLEEEIESGGEIFTRTYIPASRGDMEAYSNYWICGERTYVPDDVFERLLIQLGHDDVMDDFVLTENINTIEQISISDYHNYPNGELLENLTGLEAFTAVRNLDIQLANLAEIDLSGNINLERLFLGSPALTSLDLSSNVKLNSLYFEFANVHSLDLSQNLELRAVELQLLPLPLLDISNNLKLEMLTIEGGGFKELVAIENPVLWHLNLGNNEMEQVDVTLFPNLKELILDDNLLTALDVSNLSKLEVLEVQRNLLTALDVSHNPNLFQLAASQNPYLDCIQVARVHLDWMEQNNPSMWWGKDETTTYSLDCE